MSSTKSSTKIEIKGHSNKISEKVGQDRFNQPLIRREKSLWAFRVSVEACRMQLIKRPRNRILVFK